MKILAIDDNRDNLTALKAVVADRLPGAILLTALNGLQGLELALAEDPDVILLDIVMPDMDGYTLCRKLKEDDWLRAIPVVFLTALRTDRESRVNALEAGAEGFLSMPADEVELTAQIRTMAKIKAANRSQRLEKEQLAALVAERTRELGQELAERKRAEEEKEKLQAQLLQVLRMESVGRLAGGVAHDYNNMLAVIIANAELALEQVAPSEPLYDELQEILQAARRSAEITRQLLAFARKQVISPEVLDLNETVEVMLKMLRRLIGEDIDLAWLPGAGVCPVKVDPFQIDQVLANLCVNARDAIAGVGKVTIETGNVAFDEAYCAEHPGFAPGEYVVLAVSDDGGGMDKETLDQLFEPFFTTKEMGRGIGLGLATVYGIVKQNNGFINVYSEPGQGATFKIYLPRHAAKVEGKRREGPAAPEVRGSETILLVEDEPAMLRTTTLILERQGYTVLAASTPGEAIRLAREHADEMHLLMTDVVMPEMNGRDLAKHLLSLYPHLRRLFMSGYPADVIARHGVLDPGVHFIQKPFSMKGLAVKVREALDEK